MTEKNIMPLTEPLSDSEQAAVIFQEVCESDLKRIGSKFRPDVLGRLGNKRLAWLVEKMPEGLVIGLLMPPAKATFAAYMRGFYQRRMVHPLSRVYQGTAYLRPADTPNARDTGSSIGNDGDDMNPAVAVVRRGAQFVLSLIERGKHQVVRRTTFLYESVLRTANWPARTNFPEGTRTAPSTLKLCQPKLLPACPHFLSNAGTLQAERIGHYGRHLIKLLAQTIMNKTRSAKLQEGRRDMSDFEEVRDPHVAASRAMIELKARLSIGTQDAKLLANEDPSLTQLLYERERLEDYLYLLNTLIMQKRACNERF